MNETVRHVVCPHCDSVNRLPAAKDARTAKCGKCHKPLFTGQPAPPRRRRPSTSRSSGTTSRSSPISGPTGAAPATPWRPPMRTRRGRDGAANVRFLKVDTEAEPALAARYQIRSIPTLIVFRNGAILAQRAGAVDAGTLRSWLRQYAA